MNDGNEPSATQQATETRADQAVLTSGGLDSAILLGELVRSAITVHPLYIRNGFFWEEAELGHLKRFIHEIRTESLRPLSVLALPVNDLLPEHWSVTGRGVPDARSSDDAVFLPGRNALLLAKGMLWCQLSAVP